jgi:hypothetical protein
MWEVEIDGVVITAKDGLVVYIIDNDDNLHDEYIPVDNISGFYLDWEDIDETLELDIDDLNDHQVEMLLEAVQAT